MKYSRKEHFQEAVGVGVCACTRDLYVGTRGWIKRGKVVKYGKRRLHVCDNRYTSVGEQDMRERLEEGTFPVHSSSRWLSRV